MYAVVKDKATNYIARVFPCSLEEYTSRVRGLSSDTLDYLWVDHNAVSRVNVGDFLAHPYNYMVLEGHRPSDNNLMKLQVEDAQTKVVTVEDVDNADPNVENIPSWAKYLAIEYLIAPGGYGNGTYIGGCGSYVTNTVLKLNGNRNLTLTLGDPGNSTRPTAGSLILSVDGYTLYDLAGGCGGVIPPDDTENGVYNPVAGSGGFWQASVGGPTFNGDSRTTVSVLKGFGGGGDSGPGEPGCARVYFSSTPPMIDGPIISVDTLPSLQFDGMSYTGSTQILGKGVSNVTIPADANYICIPYACAGGGYGRNTTGGQGSYILGTWWRIYPGDLITFTVGAGGSSTGNADGGDTTVVYVMKDSVIPMFYLKGGKSTGAGGHFLIGSGANLFDGKDSVSQPPLGVTSNNGGGGTSGNSGQDGVVSYIYSKTPPAGVTIFDAREDPTYDQSS